MSDSFDRLVLPLIKERLGGRIRRPTRGRWTAEQVGGGYELTLTMDAATLCGDFQATTAASPAYLLCFGWWLQQITGAPVRSVVRVVGDAPAAPGPRRHWRRSQFLLSQYEALLGPAFTVQSPDRWRWPDSPIVNAPQQVRVHADQASHKAEQRLEAGLCREPEAHAAFCRLIEPVHPFQRQLPVGLFGGEVANANRWTPGGCSQIDLWTASVDGDTVHLFELKAMHGTRPNAPLGILPEALYYLRLWHHVRVGTSGPPIGGAGPGLQAAWEARRVVMWLSAPALHPLLGDRENTPLSAFRPELQAEGCDLRILPLRLGPDGLWAGWGSPSPPNRVSCPPDSPGPERA